MDLKKYYLRRLTRLEPPYILAVLLLFVLALTVQGESAGSLFPHLAASLFYLHGLVYGSFSPVIGVGWSLEIEIQFYLLVPLLTSLFMIHSRRARRAAMVAAIFLLLSLQVLFLPQSHRMALSILAYLQFFLAGFILADIYVADWKQSPRRTFYWDVVSTCAWPALMVMLHSNALTHWLFPFVVLLLYCSAFRGRVSSRIFRNPFLTVIGGMCYSIYLLHYEVISAVGRHTKTIAEGAPYYIYLLVQFALIALPIVVICGIYFVAIEKPCMRRDWPQRLWQLAHRTPARMPVAQ
ncbi:MAG: acyltransferase family protein [Terriglobales bacterium]